ncbi:MULTISPECIES: GTP cyclohydrolase FolE2 [Gammaproteobacteria]|uniref:GTP cyclohydrolase FolE2 n=1 Tax=Gammaproteobacteria TaxID=1236 RepID=UPI000DD05E85|nr:MULTISPECIES: GTP cyclohydrolase FolE2 [Gammaproteobacteria]RTE86244.1 GTP cyclohydrolase I FolE2 [Aliidiomarina sp. B3213]TCZ91595.1 GTP cyclohydrolase I FolE2 [Lysobacter sp. N42]
MTSSMPDIASHTKTAHVGTLDWVGMSEIEMPLMFVDNGETTRVGARVDAFVSLDKEEAKGIHMSRLYLALEALSAEGEVTPEGIKKLLETFIETHADLSDNAMVAIRFDHHLRRNALLSGKQGWKAYPVEIKGEMRSGKFHCDVSVDVTYSSTCPCSAALARQLIQEAFRDKFAQEQVSTETVAEWLGSQQGIVATPHSQRSIAEIKVRLNEQADSFLVQQLIDEAEAQLKTPVQAAVKREDEQEFARLNGQNNMFCEDAGRILKKALNEHKAVADFRVRINHYESLHAHDAVSIVTKGVPNGFTA